jgi:glycosyl transferase family 87
MNGRIGNAALIALALIGIAARLGTLLNLERTYLCTADFPVFYAGGKLAGGQIYEPAKIQAVQKTEVGCTVPSSIFLRPPYYALLTRPLAALPFAAAFGVWRLLSLACVAGFIALWPVAWRWGLLVCAWSLPFSWCLTNGQDGAFLLLFLAAAVWLIRRKHPFHAGVVLALCAAKFHLFLFLPFWILGKRMWPVGKGLLLGGSLLAALSFFAAGWNWPVAYLRSITNPRIDPASQMPNIRGLAAGNIGVEIALCLLVTACVWYLCRVAPPLVGLSAAVVGGLLVSHHMVPSDAILLWPAAFVVFREANIPVLRLAAILLITPLGHVAAVLCGPVFAAAELGLLFGLAWSAFRERTAVKLVPEGSGAVPSFFS